ncbi:type VI secretion system protein [Variovorax sp. OV329]|uniref:type VI secretion system protein n=1 Tax=Variovorax sp. OV329 TaxID=1882825 RepID=UPI0008ED9561|nr:type VI secretion system protein [Variovorax sp. OV329]SFM80722.1 ImcF-related N-terminal domain-containing protein [Variovorax sp. OV329]
MSEAQFHLLWQVSAASLLALALLWWVARGARRWARQRSLRAAHARSGGVVHPALEQAFGQAREALQPGAARLRPQALYARPWMLFLGDRASRVSDLLAAAASNREGRAPHGDASISFWRWWLMPQVVAIETDPRLIEPAPAQDTPGSRALMSAWYQGLLLLAERRGTLPLDGIALCVDASSLLAGPEVASDLAARLRERADDASHQLRMRLPTQVLITGLDRLPGYAAVRDALPEDVLAQAVGFRVPAGTLVVIDDVLGELSQRLRALRMTLLCQQTDAAGRLAVHEFFVQWLALQAGLGSFLKRLFAPGGAPYRLRGRALYFVAAPEGQSRAPAFVTELFTRFFPLERAFPTLRK